MAKIGVRKADFARPAYCDEIRLKTEKIMLNI